MHWSTAAGGGAPRVALHIQDRERNGLCARGVVLHCICCMHCPARQPRTVPQLGNTLSMRNFRAQHCTNCIAPCSFSTQAPCNSVVAGSAASAVAHHGQSPAGLGARLSAAIVVGLPVKCPRQPSKIGALFMCSTLLVLLSRAVVAGSLRVTWQVAGHMHACWQLASLAAGSPPSRLCTALSRHSLTTLHLYLRCAALRWVLAQAHAYS